MVCVVIQRVDLAQNTYGFFQAYNELSGSSYLCSATRDFTCVSSS